MLRYEILKLIKDIVKTDATLERPSVEKHGDFSTNIALKTKTDPDKIINELKDNDLFEKVEKAGPGFINIYLSKETLQNELNKILKEKDKYGQLKNGKGKKIQVEFVSANPTGPLTVGNARGGPYGDTLANILKKAGYNVEKAYYVNDFGNQIKTLGHSVLKDKEAQYKGEYINELNKENKEKDPFKVGQWAAKYIIKNYIQKTTEQMGIKYNEWIFESDLHESGKVDKILDFLRKKELIYKEGGAEWFKAKKLGDERDRVVVKKDKNKTYLAGDIALHNYKFKDKKFDKVINIWGADHHGDVKGMLAGVEAIGYKGKLEILLYQFVTILEKGKAKRMSKRAGNYVYMDELLEKTGKDATRFFFLQKSPNTHLNFDINLAQEQSSKNPIYYVQYAHARICSILKKVKEEGNVILSKAKDLDSSGFAFRMTKEELDLIRELIKFPEIIEDTAKDYQTQRLPQYSMELAHKFHKFYENCRVMDNQSRINLIKATKIILNNTLDLMGISAPEKM